MIKGAEQRLKEAQELNSSPESIQIFQEHLSPKNMIDDSNLKPYTDILGMNVVQSTTDMEELAPPGYQIVNFLGKKFLEPLEIDEFGTGNDTARIRFLDNLTQIDYEKLQKINNNRKDKLDHI